MEKELFTQAVGRRPKKCWVFWIYQLMQPESSGPATQLLPKSWLLDHPATQEKG